MTDIHLDQKFKTILCVEAFFHNLTVQDELDCLNQVRRQLEPDGRFVFNLPNPNLDFFLSCRKSRGEIFSERGRYDINHSTDTLLVEQANKINFSEQMVFTRLRLTRCDQQGHKVEQGESGWTTRYLYPNEAAHLFYRCGLEVESLVGDYHNGPVTEKSQLIAQARLSRSTRK